MINAHHRYRWIVINSSGGKDSQTALRETVRQCREAGVPHERLRVSHQDLGEVDWPQVLELVHRQADAYGIPVLVSRYRNKDGKELTLLDRVRKRGKWPDSKNRYCTADFKRDPGGRVIRQLCREDPGDVLNVFGFRASESPARAKRPVFSVNSRLSTSTRVVHDWLPIHSWSEERVWADIRESGIPHHPAYDLGMPRLSCQFCIFAPRAALMIAGKANPDLLDEYCEIEERIGHDFQHKKPIREIREALQRGDPIPVKLEPWKM